MGDTPIYEMPALPEEIRTRENTAQVFYNSLETLYRTAGLKFTQPLEDLRRVQLRLQYQQEGSKPEEVTPQEAALAAWDLIALTTYAQNVINTDPDYNGANGMLGIYTHNALAYMIRSTESVLIASSKSPSNPPVETKFAEGRGLLKNIRQGAGRLLGSTESTKKKFSSIRDAVNQLITLRGFRRQQLTPQYLEELKSVAKDIIRLGKSNGNIETAFAEIERQIKLKQDEPALDARREFQQILTRAEPDDKTYLTPENLKQYEKFFKNPNFRRDILQLKHVEPLARLKIIMKLLSEHYLYHKRDIQFAREYMSFDKEFTDEEFTIEDISTFKLAQLLTQYNPSAAEHIASPNPEDFFLYLMAKALYLKYFPERTHYIKGASGESNEIALNQLNATEFIAEWPVVDRTTASHNSAPIDYDQVIRRGLTNGDAFATELNIVLRSEVLNPVLTAITGLLPLSKVDQKLRGEAVEELGEVERPKITGKTLLTTATLDRVVKAFVHFTPRIFINREKGGYETLHQKQLDRLTHNLEELERYLAAVATI